MGFGSEHLSILFAGKSDLDLERIITSGWNACAMTSRRSFLIGTGVISLSVLGAYSFSSGIRDWLRQQIEEDFGYDIANDMETSAFLIDYLETLNIEKEREARLAAAYFRIKPAFLPSFLDSELAVRGHMLNYFIRSTNVIMALEDNQPFRYAGIFNPTVSPCQNQLAAQAL